MSRLIDSIIEDVLDNVGYKVDWMKAGIDELESYKMVVECVEECVEEYGGIDEARSNLSDFFDCVLGCLESRVEDMEVEEDGW